MLGVSRKPSFEVLVQVSRGLVEPERAIEVRVPTPDLVLGVAEVGPELNDSAPDAGV
ncbi:MAG: hypothetical protein ABI627_06430 [Polyangiaceae bacterium]